MAGRLPVDQFLRSFLHSLETECHAAAVHETDKEEKHEVDDEQLPAHLSAVTCEYLILTLGMRATYLYAFCRLSLERRQCWQPGKMKLCAQGREIIVNLKKLSYKIKILNFLIKETLANEKINIYYHFILKNLVINKENKFLFLKEYFFGANFKFSHSLSNVN